MQHLNLTVPVEYDFDDVLILPTVQNSETYKSRKEVNLYVSKEGPFFSGVPVIASNMSTIGTFKVAEVLSSYRMYTALHKYYTVNDYIENVTSEMYDYVFVSSGMREIDYKNLCQILDKFPEIKRINLDVANGYMKTFHQFIRKIRRLYPEHYIMAGNVVTNDGAEAIFEAAEGYKCLIKVGIGNGSVCRTRHQTGVGRPQLSAILDLSVKYPVVSDGGCKMVGDIAKAFCAGAEAVMIGSLFAGCKETGKEYYGMSSHHAQKKFNSYGDYKSSEGAVVYVENDKRLDDVAKEILGGLRSSISYCGSVNIDDFIGYRRFVKTNSLYNNKFHK